MAMLSQEPAASEASYAILKSSATNQDGRSSSLTAPNGPSQTALLQSALTNAGKASFLISCCLSLRESFKPSAFWYILEPLIN